MPSRSSVGKLAALVGLVLVVAACSGDDGAADIGPDVVTVATGAPESAQVTDETYLVSGEGGGGPRR